MEMLEGKSSVEEMLVRHADAAKSPISGTMELLPLCNMNCDMCYVRLSKTEMERMGSVYSGRDWLALGREMAIAGTLFILLTGGEPLLHPDFKEIYLGLKKLGMVLTVNTNATLIDEEWAEFFGQNKPRRINITLYGADEKTYASLCHYPEGFDRTITAIKLLREHGVDIKINGSITPANKGDAGKIIAIAKELDVPCRLDTYMYPATRERTLPYDQQARLTPEEAAAVDAVVAASGKSVEAIRRMAEEFDYKMKNAPIFPEHGMRCRAGSSSFMVNWQGQLRPCVMVDHPSVPVFDLGFQTAWNRIVGQVDQIHLSGKCAKCELRGVCKVCAACALLETGDYGGTPEYMCRYTQESLRLLRQPLTDTLQSK